MINLQAEQAINETIISICELIQKTIKGDSTIEKDQLPSLVDALAKLVN